MDGLAIAAALHELRAAAGGGIIRTVYQPTSSTFVLHIHAGSSCRILVDPRKATVHLSELDLPNPPEPSPFVMFLRRHLRGAKIIAVRQRGWDRVVTFSIERREGRIMRSYELVAELVGVRGNLFLTEGAKILRSAHPDRDNRPTAAYVPVRPQDKVDPRDLTVETLAELLAVEPATRALIRTIDGLGQLTAEDLLRIADSVLSRDDKAVAVHAALQTMLECIETPSPYVDHSEGRAAFYPLPPPAEPIAAFWRGLDAAFETTHVGAEDSRDSLQRALDLAIVRRKRTLAKLQGWLDHAKEAGCLQSTADLLMIHHTEIRPSAAHVDLRDPMTGETHSIDLLPHLTAIQNAQRLYTRARRLRRGRPLVAARIGQLEKQIQLLDHATRTHSEGLPVDDDARALLPKEQSKKPPGSTAGNRNRTVVFGGFTILIGKSARDNDRLLRSASPHDLWLHAKDVAGSHVIIRRGGRQSIPNEVVTHAARLAAKHSKASTERRVEILLADVKHVRKPRGAAPGLVNVMQGDTLTVDL